MSTNVLVGDYYSRSNAESESPEGIVPISVNVHWQGKAVLLEREAASASQGYVPADTVTSEGFKADGMKIPKPQHLAERNDAGNTDQIPDMFADLDDVHFVSLAVPEAVSTESE